VVIPKLGLDEILILIEKAISKLEIQDVESERTMQIVFFNLARELALFLKKSEK